MALVATDNLFIEILHATPRSAIAPLIIEVDATAFIQRSSSIEKPHTAIIEKYPPYSHGADLIYLSASGRYYLRASPAWYNGGKESWLAIVHSAISEVLPTVFRYRFPPTRRRVAAGTDSRRTSDRVRSTVLIHTSCGRGRCAAPYSSADAESEGLCCWPGFPF